MIIFLVYLSVGIVVEEKQVCIIEIRKALFSYLLSYLATFLQWRIRRLLFSMICDI